MSSPQNGEKPHLSNSSVNRYLSCGETYRRVYLCGERLPPGFALIRGLSVHKAAEHNFRQKLVTHEDLPANVLTDVAVAHVEETILVDGFSPTKEERSAGVSQTIGRLKDRAAAMTTTFSSQVAPRIMPVVVESEFRIELPNCSHDLVGRTDVEEEESLIDLKTSSRRQSQEEADNSLQLTIYAAARELRTGVPPRDLRLEVLVDTKVPASQTLITTRGPRDREVLAARINAVIGGLGAGQFLPAPLGAWWCSEKWCGFWPTCPYVNAERRAASAE